MESEQLKKRIKFLTKITNNEVLITKLLFLVLLGCSYFLSKLTRLVIPVLGFGELILIGTIAILYFAPKYFRHKKEELSKLVQYADNAQTEEQQFFAKNLQIVATFDKPISKQDHAKLCDFEQQYVLFCKQSDEHTPAKSSKRLQILYIVSFILLGCIAWVAILTQNLAVASVLEWLFHGSGALIWLLLLLLSMILGNYIMKKRKNKRSKIIAQIEKELNCTVRSMTDSEKELYK